MFWPWILLHINTPFPMHGLSQTYVICNLALPCIFQVICYFKPHNSSISIDIQMLNSALTTFSVRFSATRWPMQKSETRCYSTARALRGPASTIPAASRALRRSPSPLPPRRPHSRSGPSGPAHELLTPISTPCFPGCLECLPTECRGREAF